MADSAIISAAKAYAKVEADFQEAVKLDRSCSERARMARNQCNAAQIAVEDARQKLLNAARSA